MNNNFKIVRILDEYRIIINAGSENGVNINDVFEIHGIIDTVYDPDTNEFLGSLDGIKAKVKVTQLHEKMSICKNVEVFSAIDHESLYGIGNLKFLMNSPKKLNVDKTQISNPELYEPLKVGDKATLITKKSSSPENQDTALKSPIATSEDNR